MIQDFYQSLIDEQTASTLCKYYYCLSFIFFIAVAPNWIPAIVGFSVSLFLILFMLLYTRPNAKECAKVKEFLQKEGYLNDKEQPMNQAMIIYMAQHDIEVPTVSERVYVCSILLLICQIVVIIGVILL